MVFQHEVLYSLVGFTGKVVVDRDGRHALASGLPLIDASERELVQRLLRLGECYSALERFCSAKLLGDAEDSEAQSSDTFEHAFALGIEECLQPYQARVLELEQELSCSPDLSLPALQLGFGEFELALPELAQLVSTVEKDRLRSIALLDFLEAAAISSGDSVRGYVYVLLRYTRRVFLSQLSAWLVYGEIISDDDFFVRRGAKDATQTSEMGSSWSEFELAPELKPAFLPMRCRSFDSLDFYAPLGILVAMYNTLAERVLFVGKVVRVLRDHLAFESWTTISLPEPAGVTDSARSPQHRASPLSRSARSPLVDTSPGTSAAGRRVASFRSPSGHGVRSFRQGVTDATGALEDAEAAVREATAAEEDVRLAQESAAVEEAEAEAEAEAALGDLAHAQTSSSVMLQQLQAFSLQLAALNLEDGGPRALEPLERLLSSMHRVASEQLWRQLHSSGMLKLLSDIKAFFFLGRGELFQSFLQAARPYMDEVPPAHLDVQQLLQASAPDSLESILRSLHLSWAARSPGSSAYEAWRSLRLDMTIDWPLQLLVQPTHVQRYNQLFNFLLLVKRVQMELHAAWNAQTQCGRLPAADRAVLMPLWRLRAHMAFLVDNLQYYLQVDVLEVQWQALTHVAKTCADFEQLTIEHEKCLEAMRTQCFLHAGSVSAALHEIFRLCLTLCRMLSYADVGIRAEATYREQFSSVSREFSRQSGFLFSFLSNISSPQASPHLGQLLLRLDFNHFFVGRTVGSGD